MNKERIQYSFGEDLQEEILQFSVTDLKQGFKAVELFESHFFNLTEHMIIAEALKRHYAAHYSTPSMALLQEQVKSMLRTKQWSQYVKPTDKANITKLIKKLYRKPVRNPEQVYETCRNFARYCAVKEVLETVDLYNFEAYKTMDSQIKQATSIGSELHEDKGTFLLTDAKSRIVRRRDSPPGYPTPWRQLNQIMNSGGTNIGNVIVVMGPAKRFKTGFLLNTAKGYLKKGKVILIADFENGEGALSMRADQALLGVNRQTLLSGLETDKKLLKKLRLYKRFGGEIIIKRFPAGGTAADIEKYAQWVYDTQGLKVTDLICDYPDVMGDSKNQSDETKRIGQVYIDLKNLGDKLELHSIWCPSHVNREGDKEQTKKYKATDLSKAIDKVRHADVVLGIQQSEEEKEAGIIRLELIDQRDGIGDGRIWLKGSMETQTVSELTVSQVEELEVILKESKAESNSKNIPSTKEPKKVSDL